MLLSTNLCEVEVGYFLQGLPQEMRDEISNTSCCLCGDPCDDVDDLEEDAWKGTALLDNPWFQKLADRNKKMRVTEQLEVVFLLRNLWSRCNLEAWFTGSFTSAGRM